MNEPRTVDDLIHDIAIAGIAAHEYLAMSAELDQLATDLANANRPLGAAVCRHQAYIAYRAARAELHDPEPR